MGRILRLGNVDVSLTCRVRKFTRVSDIEPNYLSTPKLIFLVSVLRIGQWGWWIVGLVD